MAVVLAVLLVFESLFGSGVSVALADAIADTGALEEVAGPSESQPVDGVVLNQGGEAAGVVPEQSSPDEGGQDDAVPSAGGVETAPSTDESSATTTDEGAPATTDEGNASATEQPVAIEAWEWTGRTENLVLSSPDGLTFAEDAEPADDGSLAATLDLSFSLDPTVEGEDIGNHTVVVAGDIFSLALPDGMTLDPGFECDVFQLDEQGMPTTVLLGAARASEDGASFVVTFADPVDIQSGVTYYVGDPVEGTQPAAEAEGRERLDAISSAVELPVTVSAGLLGEEPAQIEWLLQTSFEDPSVIQSVTLELPAAPVGGDEKGEVETSEDASSEDTSSEGQTAKEPAAVAPLRLNALAPYAMPSNALSAPAGSESEVSYATSGSTTVSMTITWCDNNSAERPKLATWAQAVIPEFSLDEGESWIPLLDENGALTQEARNALHVSVGTTPAWAHGPASSAVSVGDWVISSSGLPDKLNITTRTPTGEFDEHGQPTYVVKTDSTNIKWRLYDSNETPEGYVTGINDEGTTGTQRYFMRTQDYEFTIVGNLGGHSIEEVFGQNFSRKPFDDYFSFGASIDNAEVGSVVSLSSLQSDPRNQCTITMDGDTATVKATLPMYDINGEPIVYHIRFDDSSAVSASVHFQPAYNNAGSSGHGSATDALYDGGTMTLRPIGVTSYSATKVWLDGGDKTLRKPVTFTLWRYSTAPGASAATAAQVQLNAIDDSGAAASSVEYVSIEVPAGSSDTVNLGQLLLDRYGSAAENLPRYDPDGYPYVYALREDTSLPGYNTVYGAVAPADSPDAGEVTDTAPNYVDVNGNTQTLAYANRASDPLIYNNGTVTNRLEGSVTITGTKTWQIAAFQDSLSDVEATFTVQSRRKADGDSASGGTWTNTDVTETVTGWRAETLTRSFSKTLSRYDAWGNELEYRWVESGVKLGDQETNFQPDGAGGGTFQLTLANAEGTDETLNFKSETSLDPETGESLVTNTFENVTDQHVDKYWQQPDGSMAQVKPAADGYPDYPGLDLSGNVTVSVFRNGELYTSFTMDGVVDGAPNFIEEGLTDQQVDPYAQETRAYHVDFQNLPKYDENGVRYAYLVLENGVGGWHSTRAYDPDTRTTRIDNTVGPGEGSEVRVTKEWLDGADDTHRLDVVVQLIALKDMTNVNTGEVYEAGEVVDVSAVQNPDGTSWVDPSTNEITLSAGNAWFVEAYVPVSQVTYKDFELREVALVDGEARYPVTTRDQAAEDYKGIDMPMEWVNVGWDYNSTKGTSRVATRDHVYQVYATKDNKGEYNDAMEAVTAVNRRLGLLDLTVEKTWNDGVDHERPEAELVLSCLDEGSVFHIDETTGTVWVQLDGGNAVPVMTGSGEDAKPLNKSDGARIENGDLVMTVSTAEDQVTYRFYGLPKYDGDGQVVHYDVEERWVGDYGEYASSKSVGKYTIGNQHFHDTQTYSFANTRSAKRDVTFYKNWHDQYVNDELGQRPDIYLTLYRVTVSRGEDGIAVYGDPQVVPGYVHYVWQGTAVEGNPQYNQMCTIGGMDAYDAEGNAYIYYAQESMSVGDGGASLDYAPVKFDYDTITDGGNEDKALWVGEGEQSGNPEEDGSEWAVREDGTFVNSLTSHLVARGTKLWENVPGNVDQADLPALTIYLQRKTAEDDWRELTFTKQTDTDGNVTWVPVRGQAVAWTSDLHRVTTNQYSYQIGHAGENVLDEDGNLVNTDNQEELPRYDEEGRIYEYRAIEVPWGLYEEPGGFDDEDLGLAGGATTTVDLANLESSGKLGVFVVMHGETGSFMIRNSYSSETGNLTVEKRFAGERVTGDAYPTTTFDVHRYYVNEGGERSEDALVGSVTLTSAQLSGQEQLSGLVVTGSDPNMTAQYTFTGLDVYAPDGSYWQYYVTERGIDGYTATVQVGDVSETRTPGEDLISPELCPTSGGTASTVTGTVIQDDTTTDVTFTNEYAADSTNLKGTKVWEDYGGAFGTRPTADEFAETLTLSRSSSSMPEETLTFGAEEGDPYHLTVANGTDDSPYSISISNVEKWAPDGTAWRYTLAEKDGSEGYVALISGSTVSASSGQSLSLRNGLEGQVTVTKDWQDGGDPYGLRPTTVTVTLQARLTPRTSGAAATVSEWGGAYDTLADVMSADQRGLLDASGFSGDMEKTLKEDNGWRASWTRVPLVVCGEDGTLYDVDYRAIETKIGDQPVTMKDDGTYELCASYQPSQTEGSGLREGRWSTEIANTLTDTSISASKTWTNDYENEWDTRPGGDDWVVTYYLQRRSATSGEWQWVTEYGAEHADSPLDKGVVSQMLTASISSWTWNDLPKYDDEGKEYEYRMVEEVPGSYDVVDGTEVATVESGGVTYRYYVVEPTSGDGTTSSQAFTNDLRTTSLKGTKAWDDASNDAHEGPQPDGSNVPEVTLYRAYKTTGGAYSTRTDVTDYAGQPRWADNGDGTWEFEYTGLPAANEDNVDYVYWAVESDSVDGYYPLYGSDGSASSSEAAGTEVTKPATADAEGAQTNEAITNVATRLSLAKVSDWEGDDPLANITLSVQSADGTTYAVWTNGADGNTYETYTWVNGTKNPNDKDGAAHRTDNLIVGLHAGTYKVVETGTVPEGYAKAPDVSFTINDNGKAPMASAVSTSTENGVNTITVAATDPVLRGHLQLTKYVSADGTDKGRKPLAGATFDLYREDMDGDGKDELIARGLTTNEDGVVTTVGNEAEIEEKGSAGADLTYGGKYTTLSDGLPEGDYYFVETDATPDAVTPSGDGARSATLTIAQDDHYAYTKAPVGETMDNEEFTAQVTLHKYDSSTGAGIDGAVFSVSYVPEGGGASQSLPDATTSGGGKLVLSGLKKGTYTVTEKSNTGYDVSEPFSATFTIGNEDHGRRFDITSTECPDATDISFTVSEGAYTTSGVPNTPLRGTVSMTKVDADDDSELDGAAFELQRKTADGLWETIAEGLVTGKSYAMNDANSAHMGEPAGAGRGVITVSNLTWGTYRFVETDPAPGYVGVANGEQVKSDEVTVGRDNVSGTVSAGTVVNEPTTLEINKRSDVGEPLNGAVFTVTPAQSSSFADGSTTPIRLTTEDTGHAELDGQLVVGGTYKIYEEQGPTGYDPADGTLTIRVAEDGSIELVGTMPEFYEIKGAYTADEYPGLDDGAVIVTNAHEAISLVKVDARDSDTGLEGAEFTLTGLCMDGQTEHTYMTDENGAIAIDDGLRGSVRYQLRETSAPDGYAEMSEPLYFYMDDRGEIDPVDVSGAQISELPEGWSVGEDHISLTASDNPVELKITKVNREGEGLSGAYFTITPADGSSFAGGQTDPKGLSTGEDGTLSVIAELVVGGSYDITEISAPEGYERVTGTMRVSVEADGSLSVEGSVVDGALVGGLAPTGYAKADDNAFEVRVTNEPIQVGLVKVDARDSGTKLEGAEFEVTGVFAGSTAEETRSYVTDAQGRVDLDAELKSGETYALRETRAPEGYELIAGELSFTVNEGGEVSVEGAAPAGYGVEQGNVTVVATDQPLLVSLVKRGEGGAPLAGAAFTVAPADGVFPDGEAAKGFSSGSDGTVFADLQVAGSAEGTRYTVTETVPAAGYEALPAFDVLVFEDGSVELAEDAPEAVRAAFTVEDQGGTAVIGLTDELIEASLRKVSEGGEALSGAEFELTGAFADGGTRRAVTVGEDGTAPLEGLVAGETYALSETRAPEGYELIEGTWSFSVAADGTLVPAEGHEPAAEGEAGYRVADGVTVVATDRQRRRVPETGLSATGDTSQPVVPVAIAAGGMAIAAAALVTRRRTRRED